MMEILYVWGVTQLQTTELPPYLGVVVNEEIEHDEFAMQVHLRSFVLGLCRWFVRLRSR